MLKVVLLSIVSVRSYNRQIEINKGVKFNIKICLENHKVIIEKA